jgi:hypothetical protein
VDRPEQCSEKDTSGIAPKRAPDTSHEVVEVFTQIPLSLHDFIAPHKESIGTGLYYLSLGDRSKIKKDSQKSSITTPVKEKNKTLRFKLTPLAHQALEGLMDSCGFNKKEAIIASIYYLKSKPKTLLSVKI